MAQRRGAQEASLKELARGLSHSYFGAPRLADCRLLWHLLFGVQSIRLSQRFLLLALRLGALAFRLHGVLLLALCLLLQPISLEALVVRLVLFHFHLLSCGSLALLAHLHLALVRVHVDGVDEFVQQLLATQIAVDHRQHLARAARLANDEYRRQLARLQIAHHNRGSHADARQCRQEEVFVALVREVPSVQHVVVVQHLGDRVAFEQLVAKHIGQHAAVVVQVDGEQFALREREN